MRVPRIYHSEALIIDSEISLSKDAVRHVSRVLRMEIGQTIQVFDGSNQVFDAQIVYKDKKIVRVKVMAGHLENCESPVHIHLGQVIPRGKKMEFIIQKSIELGVTLITPLFSERCNIKINTTTVLNKKLEQWKKIAISACEQCGRNRIPVIYPPINLETWCAEKEVGLRLNFQANDKVNFSINALPESIERIRLLIGPEGGLSESEILMVANYGFINIMLGPRVLRTETTALTAISALQIRFGDLG